MVIKEVVLEEIGNIKQELENLRRMIQGEASGSVERFQRSYTNAIKKRRKKIL